MVERSVTRVMMMIGNGGQGMTAAATMLQDNTAAGVSAVAAAGVTTITATSTAAGVSTIPTTCADTSTQHSTPLHITLATHALHLCMHSTAGWGSNTTHHPPTHPPTVEEHPYSTLVVEGIGGALTQVLKQLVVVQKRQGTALKGKEGGGGGGKRRGGSDVQRVATPTSGAATDVHTTHTTRHKRGPSSHQYTPKGGPGTGQQHVERGDGVPVKKRRVQPLVVKSGMLVCVCACVSTCSLYVYVYV